MSPTAEDVATATECAAQLVQITAQPRTISGEVNKLLPNPMVVYDRSEQRLRVALCQPGGALHGGAHSYCQWWVGRQRPLPPFRGAMMRVYYVDTSVSWGIVMQGIVKKWGNSAAVRIPSAVLEAAQMRLEQQVDVREEGGRIIIEPIHPARYAIDDLVAAITDENRHDPVDMGPIAGKEAW